MRTKLFIVMIVFFTAHMAAVSAQNNAATLIRKGNHAFHQEDYVDAELYYRKALEEDPNNGKARYNLGNALYRQHRYNEAAAYFLDANTLIKDSSASSNMFYNLGNSLIKNGLENDTSKAQEHLQNGINAYIKSLSLNPDNEKTKYNLQYALKLLNQLQQQQQTQPDQKESDQQEQKKGSEEKEKEAKQGDDEKGNPEPPEQQEEGTLSREDAEKMLEALKEKEKAEAEKIEKKRRDRQLSKKIKDW